MSQTILLADPRRERLIGTSIWHLSLPQNQCLKNCTRPLHSNLWLPNLHRLLRKESMRTLKAYGRAWLLFLGRNQKSMSLIYSSFRREYMLCWKTSSQLFSHKGWKTRNSSLRSKNYWTKTGRWKSRYESWLKILQVYRQSSKSKLTKNVIIPALNWVLTIFPVSPATVHCQYLLLHPVLSKRNVDWSAWFRSWNLSTPNIKTCYFEAVLSPSQANHLQRSTSNDLSHFFCQFFC